jgi:tetratricopeptide (TPR) repeat protein
MQHQKIDSKNDASNIQIKRLHLPLPGPRSNKAIAKLSKTIKQAPEDAKAYFCRGMAYSNMVDYGKLVQAFNEDLDKLDAENAIANDYKNTVQLLYDYCDAAIQDFTKAIELGFVDATVYECRGNMHLQKGKCDKAMAYYTKAAELGSGYTDAYEDPALVPVPAPVPTPVHAPAPAWAPASALGPVHAPAPAPAPASALGPVPAPAPASALGPLQE